MRPFRAQRKKLGLEGSVFSRFITGTTKASIGRSRGFGGTGRACPSACSAASAISVSVDSRLPLRRGRRAPRAPAQEAAPARYPTRRLACSERPRLGWCCPVRPRAVARRGVASWLGLPHGTSESWTRRSLVALGTIAAPPCRCCSRIASLLLSWGVDLRRPAASGTRGSCSASKKLSRRAARKARPGPCCGFSTLGALRLLSQDVHAGPSSLSTLRGFRAHLLARSAPRPLVARSLVMLESRSTAHHPDHRIPSSAHAARNNHPLPQAASSRLSHWWRWSGAWLCIEARKAAPRLADLGEKRSLRLGFGHAPARHRHRAERTLPVLGARRPPLRFAFPVPRQL